MKPTFTGKRHTLPLALLSAVIAVPVFIAGCGGGSNGPGTTTAGTTTAGTTTAGTTTAGTTTAGTTTAGTTTAGTTTAGTTTAGTTTAGTTTAGTTTAGTTTAGTTTAGTTAGSTTAGGTTSGTNEPAVGLLTFTGGAGYNGLTAPVTSGFTEGDFTREGGILDVRVVTVQNNRTRNVSFTVNGPGNVAQGRTYVVNTQFPGAFAGAGYTDGNNRWSASNVIGTGGSGSIRVTALSASSVTLAINQVVLTTNGVQFPGDARGTLTINGTATFKLKAR